MLTFEQLKTDMKIVAFVDRCSVFSGTFKLEKLKTGLSYYYPITLSHIPLNKWQPLNNDSTWVKKIVAFVVVIVQLYLYIRKIENGTQKSCCLLEMVVNSGLIVTMKYNLY